MLHTPKPAGSEQLHPGQLCTHLSLYSRSPSRVLITLYVMRPPPCGVNDMREGRSASAAGWQRSNRSSQRAHSSAPAAADAAVRPAASPPAARTRPAPHKQQQPAVAHLGARSRRRSALHRLVGGVVEGNHVAQHVHGLVEGAVLVVPVGGGGRTQSGSDRCLRADGGGGSRAARRAPAPTPKRSQAPPAPCPLGVGVLLQEVVLDEARHLQRDLVALRQRVLRRGRGSRRSQPGVTEQPSACRRPPP